MNNNLGPTGSTATLTQPTTLIQPATLTKTDPLNKQELNKGTNKHTNTHETSAQTLTYLELREWYG